ncbi:hypothetical protein ACJJTC_003706 [Scirpophaga incertulas]
MRIVQNGSAGRTQLSARGATLFTYLKHDNRASHPVKIRTMGFDSETLFQCNVDVTQTCTPHSARKSGKSTHLSGEHSLPAQGYRHFASGAGRAPAPARAAPSTDSPLRVTSPPAAGRTNNIENTFPGTFQNYSTRLYRHHTISIQLNTTPFKNNQNSTAAGNKSNQS